MPHPSYLVEALQNYTIDHLIDLLECTLEEFFFEFDTHGEIKIKDMSYGSFTEMLDELAWEIGEKVVTQIGDIVEEEPLASWVTEEVRTYLEERAKNQWCIQYEAMEKLMRSPDIRLEAIEAIKKSGVLHAQVVHEMMNSNEIKREAVESLKQMECVKQQAINELLGCPHIKARAVEEIKNRLLT